MNSAAQSDILNDLSSELLESVVQIPSIESFLKKTDANSRQSIRSALCSALSFLLNQDKQVFLSDLGIFFSESKEQSAYYPQESNAVLRSEVRQYIQFEKCDDANAIDRVRFPNVVSDSELIQLVYAGLPLELQLKWSKREFGPILRRLMRLIREEVVLEGISFQLDKLGILYAFHSKQGQTSKEWYAGADIIFDSNENRLMDVSSSKQLQRPILENSFEPLEAAFGKPMQVKRIDLGTELESLGYDREEFERSCPIKARTFKVATYLVGDAKDSRQKLVYCTDGLRFACTDKSKVASELTFQLYLKDVQPYEAVLDPAEVPEWPARVFTLGWILLHSRQSKTLVPELGIQADVCITGNPNGHLTDIITAPFEHILSPQLCNSRQFHYINLLGLCHSEIQNFGGLQSKRLFKLLEYRKLSQVTRLRRPLLSASTAPAPHSMNASLRSGSVRLGEPCNTDSSNLKCVSV